jgi:hypothetical protein
VRTVLQEEDQPARHGGGKSDRSIMITLVHESGIVQKHTTRDERLRAMQERHYLLERGRLCSACLTGSWPMNQFRMAQYLCDGCLRLDLKITRLADADTRAVTLTETQRTESLSYRSTQLRRAFAAATDLGLLVMPIEGGRVLAAPDLAQVLPDDATAAARRFASWMRAVAPEAASERDATLSRIDEFVIDDVTD